MPPSEAQKRANKKQDATRKRVPLWLTPEEAKALDKLVKREGVASRAEALRIWLEHEGVLKVKR